MKVFITMLFLSIAITSFKVNKPVTTPSVLQPRGGLPNFFKKLGKGKPVTIAYLGGSITEAPGYRVQTEAYFKSTYPSSAIKTVNAGVGGTGSYLGVFRLGHDVLAEKPDMVFIEFAVNDFKGDSLKVCNAMEGIIRQIWRANKQTDICLLYTIHEPMIAEYRAGNLPSSVRYMERIAAHYNLPSINLAPDVLGRLQQGTLIFKAEKNSDQQGKLIFTNDNTHPTTEGHTVYTQTIVNALKQLELLQPQKKWLPQSLYAENLQYTTMVSPSKRKQYGNWQPGTSLPELKSFMKSFPDLIYTNSVNDSLVLKFSGRQLGFGDVIGPSSAGAIIIVDGKTITRKRFDEYCSYYRRSFFFVDSLSDGPHTVSIKLDTSRINKLKMLRPGNKGDLTRYERNELYIGNIMLSKER